MRFLQLIVSILAFIAAMPALGASDPRVADITLCRESWLDWKKNDPAALESFGAFLRTAFSPEESDGSLEPKTDTAIDGLKITRVFPGSVGMGLGFSVIVDVPFDVARQALELDVGKRLGHCQASDGMRSCELPITEQRTIMLVSGDAPNGRTTLAGCYYYYEK